LLGKGVGGLGLFRQPPTYSAALRARLGIPRKSCRFISPPCLRPLAGSLFPAAAPRGSVWGVRHCATNNSRSNPVLVGTAPQAGHAHALRPPRWQRPGSAPSRSGTPLAPLRPAPGTDRRVAAHSSRGGHGGDSLAPAPPVARSLPDDGDARGRDSSPVDF